MGCSGSNLGAVPPAGVFTLAGVASQRVPDPLEDDEDDVTMVLLSTAVSAAVVRRASMKVVLSVDGEDDTGLGAPPTCTVPFNAGGAAAPPLPTASEDEPPTLPLPLPVETTPAAMTEGAQSDPKTAAARLVLAFEHHVRHNARTFLPLLP
jgi:hypothetical protein